MTEPSSLLLVLLSSLTSAAGPILLKQGMKPIQIKKLALGTFLYVIGIGLFILALQGGELSTLYPLISITYVWVLLLGHYWLKERISNLQKLGVFAIILGVIIIAV